MKDLVRHAVADTSYVGVAPESLSVRVGKRQGFGLSVIPKFLDLSYLKCTVF